MNTEAVHWSKVLRAYLDPVMLRVLMNGVVSGLPWVMIGSALTLWLQENGYSRSGIGLFALLGAAYALNLLWAPLVDGLQVPGLTRLLGERRAWIISMQAIILLALLGIGMLDPQQPAQLSLLIGLMLVIAVAGATQDVAIDAQRIELVASTDAEKVAVGAATTTIGWWIGYGFGGAFALGLSQYLEAVVPGRHWQLTYQALAVVVGLCMLLSCIGKAQLHRPEGLQRAATAGGAQPRSRLGALFVAPVLSFIYRYGLKIGLSVVALIFLFKLGEAFLGRMSILFYREVGFSKVDIALYSKGFGTLAYCLFAVLGSLISVRYGLFRGVLIGGIAMAGTNLLFAWLSLAPSPQLFAFAVVADQFTTAVSTVAFVAFISQLCDRAYTATQYAALASLGNLARTTLAAGSGFVVDALHGNWALFFVLTTMLALPGLLLLIGLRRPLAPVLSGAKTGIL